MKKINKIKTFILALSIISILFITIEMTLAFLMSETKPLSTTFKPFGFIKKDLTIEKTIEHNFGNDYTIPEELAFDFTINLGTEYKNKVISTTLGEKTADDNGNITISLKPNQEFKIENIFEGTNVKVTETQNKAGFTAKNNETEKEITINSTDEPKLSFINVYEPTKLELTNINFTGIKNLEGRNWQENDSFSFQLEYKNNNDWIPIGNKTITYDKEKEDFNQFNFTEIIEALEFTNIGTYSFRISEIEGALENVTYDKTINYFDIIVTDNDMDGKLELNNIEGRQNIKVTEENNEFNINVEFNNTFKVETPSIKYVDKKENSFEEEDMIIVRNAEYNIKTVLSKFEGLGKDYTYKLYDKNNKEVNTELVRTGDRLEITVNKTVFKYYIVKKGDVSGDGEITPLDYVSIKNHIMETKKIKGDVYLIAADYNDDTEISPLDYVKVKNHIMNGVN